MNRDQRLIGRTRDLARFDAAMRASASPILVMGDAGIGKTRLVAEILSRHRENGGVGFVGGCLPMSSPLPLLPFTEVLRGLAAVDRGRLLQQVLRLTSPYVRSELTRVLPELADGDTVETRGSDDLAWSRDRLFNAIREVFVALGQEHSALLVVEDLHWADQSTLDLLTYLVSALRTSSVTFVITSRTDEALPEYVNDWLSRIHRMPSAEIRLGGLTVSEVAQLAVDALTEEPSESDVVELHRRTGGNPFFLEQLLAEAGATVGTHYRGALPQGLADLLAIRLRAISAEARDVLTALAVVGRPVGVEFAAAVAQLPRARVLDGLRELRTARLLDDMDALTGYLVRHNLLAEAVLLDVAPAERQALHARAALVLENSLAVGSAGEAASHWRAADRPLDELRATVAAAERACAVFAFAEAAALGRRAIQLCDEHPDAAELLKIDAVALHFKAIEALSSSGHKRESHALAEAALTRFADSSDAQSIALLYLVVAEHRGVLEPAAAMPLVVRAVQTYDRLPPSPGQARALTALADYTRRQGDLDSSASLFEQALEIGQAVGATGQSVWVLTGLARTRLSQGAVDEALAIFARGRALASELIDGRADQEPVLTLAIAEGDAYLKLGRLEDAERVSQEGLESAIRCGRERSYRGQLLASNAAESMLERGALERARALLLPLTGEEPSELGWAVLHRARAEADLNYGDVVAARQRLDRVFAAAHFDPSDDRDFAQDFVDTALWGAAPAEALEVAIRATARCVGTDEELHSGELLAQGARAVADLAEASRARRNTADLEHALADLGRLEANLIRMSDRAFVDHPAVVRIAGDRAQWDAERARARGATDPDLWTLSAQCWEALGRPPRAAYAWWRCAEAMLMCGASPATVGAPLRRAATAAKGMVPVLREVRQLAGRLRIPLDCSSPTSTSRARRRTSPSAAGDHAAAHDPYGLTDRELRVLRRVAAGRTNAQIGAELYISPKTVSVHVTNILRKLAVDNRTQAAAIAERAGLLTD